MRKSAIGLTISSALMAIIGFVLVYCFGYGVEINAALSSLLDVISFKDASYQALAVSLYIVDIAVILFFIANLVYIILRHKFGYIAVLLASLIIASGGNLIVGIYAPEINDPNFNPVFILGVIMGYVLSSVLLILDLVVLFGYLMNYRHHIQKQKEEKIKEDNTIHIHENSIYHIRYNYASNKWYIIEEKYNNPIVNYDKCSDAVAFANKFLKTNGSVVFIHDEKDKITKL